MSCKKSRAIQIPPDKHVSKSCVSTDRSHPANMI